MRKTDKRLYHLLLMGYVLGSLSLTAQADNGIIVITRDVQTRNAVVPPLRPDPNPTTVNANPSAHILKQTNELSDGDFANISSGAGISTLITQQTNNLGGNLNNQSQLPNLAGGRGTGSGNGISNMVNSSVQRGLAPLQILTGGK
ncbi:hypothetical protein CXG50_25670 [Pseudomonas plecoglossicida]|uniref:Uncharacterized protein n=4 Tax=Pseudomonas TaxID=286 RepID=A0ABX4TVW3_PSEDL|nr:MULTISPECIES: hypothetical protein [Pseudomonas]KXK72418.1 hypothetical protein BC89_01500 [Pseudomonas monteilii]GJB82920.1 hypothetical protein KAM380_073850 [Aeromonas caviae]AGA73339.1 hypothetical protein B479_12215 [Pseudomonas putida HB3267]KPM66705.1 hypothetical protein HB13667_08155 [Pseudomonas putida]KYC16988.1 hypothetical protein WM94_23060 [Pseudomonas sp. ABFPK]